MTPRKTDIVRERFKERGLSYKKIDKTAINFLYIYLNKTLEGTGMSVNYSKGMDKRGKFNEDGSIIEFYITVDGEYYTDRECISFNRDGFIGFCGWASSRNEAPIIEAFEMWCNYLCNRKNFDLYLKGENVNE